MCERFKSTIMVTWSGEFKYIKVKDKQLDTTYELSSSFDIDYLLNSLNESIVLAENKALPLHMKIKNKLRI